ncbi:hypothetical protein ANCDUO_23187 [Ancylostoma duodenale]|uniref:Uncharacterized protein n=1 Tax=Ancylostoma duodenale TaxID=51022 RepID=A0A0C2BSB6_9BILA|nr:hypothetical protein ANCDUO_23187 [Ancylostoma duodenale]
MPLSTTSTKNTIGLFNIPRQRKESRGLKIHQKTTVLRDPRADTPAWSRESRRQLPTNVRARKTVQRSDKRRP